MRMLTGTVLALSAGCAGNGISEEVLGIARATMPAGEFHIELDAHGEVIEAGGAVPLESVPKACRAAVDAAHPGGTQTGAERVFVDGERAWMVAKQIDGRGHEILVSDRGEVFGGEEVLVQGSWPAAIVAAAQAAVPEATIERVERVWGTEARGAEAFHVKLRERGESVRVGLSKDAEVLRVVRRIAGQVRVPR